MLNEIVHAGVIAPKHADLPRFVAIPSGVVAKWKLPGTTVVEGLLDGVELGRRTIQPWGKDRWFIGIPETLCKKAGVDTGSRVTLTIRLVSTELPEELVALLAADAGARAAWDALTTAQQRMLRENVATAKQLATRRRRAEQELKRA